MKHLILTLALLLSLGASARAAEFTAAAIPAHGTQATAEEWLGALADLKTINATGMVITKTWGEMEPAKRQYKGMLQLGKDFRSNAKDGRQVFFGFQGINTVKRDMPADLMKTAWDDPAMIGRFTEWFDHLMLESPTPPRFISLANEADIYFERHPKELDAFLKFYLAATSVIKRNGFPSARTGITVTYEGLMRGRGEIIRKLVEASEVAIFTYYPVIDLKAQPVENVGGNIDAMLTVAGEKDVILQEVGYPSGEALGSTPEKQAFFFETAINVIRNRDQIQFASLFMLHDFPPQMCDDFVKYYGFEKAPAEPKKKFREFLCTLGLKTYEGAEKPAWAAVKEALK